MTLRWNGDAVVRRIEARAAEAMAETVDAAIAEAGPNTPVDTGATRDSLRREGDGLRLRWGYHTRYGIWLEIGARGKAGVHALRRAADHQYGQLVSRIRGRSI